MKQKCLFNYDSQSIQETINKKFRKTVVWILFKFNKWYKIITAANIFIIISKRFYLDIYTNFNSYSNNLYLS